MKASFLLSILFLSCFSSAQRFYLGIENQSGFSLTGSFTGNSYKDITPDENSYTFIKGSLGSGNTISLNGSFFLKEHLSFGTKISYFRGFEQLLYLYDKSPVFEQIKARTSGFMLQPVFTLSHPLKKMTLFSRTGLILPLGMKTAQSREYLDEMIDSSVYSTSELTYRYTFGFSQGFGTKVDLSKHLALELSLGIQLFNMEFKQEKTKSFKINNSESVQTMNQYDLQTNYQYNISNYSNNSLYNPFTNFNQAKDELVSSHHFSVLTLGICFFYKF